MSYDDTPHYEAETFLKNHLDALLKPIVCRLSGRHAREMSASSLVRPQRFDTGADKLLHTSVFAARQLLSQSHPAW